jgi:hypothetical protein
MSYNKILFIFLIFISYTKQLNILINQKKINLFNNIYLIIIIKFLNFHLNNILLFKFK